MLKQYITFSMALHAVIQAIISALMPVALFTFLFVWLQKKFGWPDYALALGIGFGVIVGIYTMFRFVILTTRAWERAQKQKEQQSKNETR